MRIKKYLAFPIAFISLLLTHQLTYFILYPNGSIREAIFDATGHIWIKSIPEALTYTFLLIVYLIWQSKPSLLRGLSLFKIALVQYLAFVALEFSERILSGSNPIPNFKILLIGLLLTFFSSYVINLVVEKVIVQVITSLKKLLNKEKNYKKVLSPSQYLYLFFIFSKFISLTAPRSPPVK